MAKCSGTPKINVQSFGIYTTGASITVKRNRLSLSFIQLTELDILLIDRGANSDCAFTTKRPVIERDGV